MASTGIAGTDLNRSLKYNPRSRTGFEESARRRSLVEWRRKIWSPTSVRTGLTNHPPVPCHRQDTCPPTGDDKTSILFGIQDKTGALFSALDR